MTLAYRLSDSVVLIEAGIFIHTVKSEVERTT